MKHGKKLFFMILSVCSYSLSMEQTFQEDIKNWSNNAITTRLREIANISEQMDGILPQQLTREQRLLFREQDRRSELEEELERIEARNRITATKERIKKEMRERETRISGKRLAKALKSLQASLIRLSIKIG